MFHPPWLPLNRQSNYFAAAATAMTTTASTRTKHVYYHVWFRKQETIFILLDSFHKQHTVFQSKIHKFTI